jgi:hypothetical protein
MQYEGIRRSRAFPEPSWLAGRPDPVIDGMPEVLRDDLRWLKRHYLAEQVRAMRPAAPDRAWRAFDRALFERLRCRQEARDG